MPFTQFFIPFTQKTIPFPKFSGCVEFNKFKCFKFKRIIYNQYLIKQL